MLISYDQSDRAAESERPSFGVAGALFPKLTAEVRALSQAVRSLGETTGSATRRIRQVEEAVLGLDALNAAVSRLELHVAGLVEAISVQASSLREIEEGERRIEAAAAKLEASLGGGVLRAGVEQLAQVVGRIDAALAGVSHGVAQLGQGFTRVDETMVNLGSGLAQVAAGLGERFESLSTAVSSHQTASSQSDVDLISGFGRLDATMVAFGARMDEGNTQITARLNAALQSLEQLSATGGSLQNAEIWNRLEAIETALERRVDAVGQRLDMIETATQQRLDVFDRNIVDGFDLAVRTIWEAKAAISSEVAHLPNQISDAGLAGGLGRSADGVPLDKLLFPRTHTDDVQHIDMDQVVAEMAGSARAKLVKTAADDVIAALGVADLAAMARNSPELGGIDWAPYIRLSELRAARVFQALRMHAPKKARILDFGAYFGNFSLALARAGFIVDALDAYAGPFAGALEPFVTMMREAGVNVRDVGDIGYDLAGLDADAYDVVLFLGAIEHVPHTPRETLNAITRVLKPSGVLILDTPNLGYAYKRRAFVSGETVHPPIQHQFVAEVPFFGHHREYLPQEVRWMLEKIGHEIVETDMYNYSVFGMNELRGEHLALWRLMQEHPHLRELIFTVSRRGA